MLVREVRPRVAVRAVVLAHGAPLALPQIGTKQAIALALLLEASSFFVTPFPLMGGDRSPPCPPPRRGRAPPPPPARGRPLFQARTEAYGCSVKYGS